MQCDYLADTVSRLDVADVQRCGRASQPEDRCSVTHESFDRFATPPTPVCSYTAPMHESLPSAMVNVVFSLQDMAVPPQERLVLNSVAAVDF